MRILKKYIIFILLVGMFVSICMAQQKATSIRVGLIADPQYANKGDSKTRFYRNSLQKLDDAVDKLNQFSLDMSVVLGDMVDDGPSEAEAIMFRLKKLKMPMYPILGNHDYPNEYEADVFKKYAMPAEYYTIEIGDWKFLFLNTNELSSYATKAGSVLAQEYLTLVEKETSLGRTHLKSWNGGVGKEQIEWIEKKIKDATINGKHIVVFTHHPLYPEIGYEVFNNRELLELFAKHKCVKAILSGHNHAGNFMLYQDLPCITLEGMIETMDQSAFGYMELFNNKLEIHGYGRMTSRVLELR